MLWAILIAIIILIFKPEIMERGHYARKRIAKDWRRLKRWRATKSMPPDSR